MSRLTTTDFNNAANAYDIAKRCGPIIVLGPHNGWNVPSSLYDGDKPLGVESWWFDPNSPKKRHEACDWGMTQLFTALDDTFSKTNCSVLSSRISRLVVDLNRNPNAKGDIWITTHADEYGAKNAQERGIEIPANNHITNENKEWRRTRFYDPWFDKIEILVKNAKEHNPTEQITILDLHTFTPTWHDQKRQLDIGSLRLNDSGISGIISPIFKKKCAAKNIEFKQDAPYSLRTNSDIKRRFAAKFLHEKFNVQYFGFEMRNDLLQNPKHCAEVAAIVGETIEHLAA